MTCGQLQTVGWGEIRYHKLLGVALEATSRHHTVFHGLLLSLLLLLHCQGCTQVSAGLMHGNTVGDASNCLGTLCKSRFGALARALAHFIWALPTARRMTLCHQYEYMSTLDRFVPLSL